MNSTVNKRVNNRVNITVNIIVNSTVIRSVNCTVVCKVRKIQLTSWLVESISRHVCHSVCLGDVQGVQSLSRDERDKKNLILNDR